MKALPDLDSCTVALIGLGYVGLPLAVCISQKHLLNKEELQHKHKVIGFDIDHSRVLQLSANYDRTLEISNTILQETSNLSFTSNPADLISADVFIITVPTPVDKSKNPNLDALSSASITVGNILKQKAEDGCLLSPIVIFESTVYPGATRDFCLPLIESASNLKCNTDFCIGYSPERLSPGNPAHSLQNIVKVTSASSTLSADWVNSFYSSIVTAGTFKASSIEVAEAAKVVENTQRDLNIALMNELSIIFKLMNVNFSEVLLAAGTKWNFHKFRPGLVGGHCIGVDPYYLTHISEKYGYSPTLINSARRVNEHMALNISHDIIKELTKRYINPCNSKVLVLGLSYKENCSDLRNTKVIDLVHHLCEFNVDITVIDPCVDIDSANRLVPCSVSEQLQDNEQYHAVIVCVAHSNFKNYTATEWSNLILEGGFVYDLHNIVPDIIQPVRI